MVGGMYSVGSSESPRSLSQFGSTTASGSGCGTSAKAMSVLMLVTISSMRSGTRSRGADRGLGYCPGYRRGRAARVAMVVPRWYRLSVAMNLRLTDEEAEALRRRDEQE